MLSQPKVAARAEQPYAAIPIKATLREWGKANALVGEVFTWLDRKGIQPAGPPFYRYRVVGGLDEPFEIEVGVSVPSPVTGDGRVMAGAIPAGRDATAVHTGHPDRLVPSLTELETWIATQGMAPTTTRRGADEVWPAGSSST